MSLIGDFDREIDATTREIDGSAPRPTSASSVLCQIHGVGRYTAMLIIAEIGDVTRFPTARHLCAWAGLAPTVRSSDGKARLGHISRQGSPALRWALIEAAQKIPTGGGPLRAKFERIAKRRGRNIAKVAVARADPHPLLLRAARRRDPLPQTRRTRASTTREAGRGRMTHRQLTQQHLRPRRARGARSGELAPMSGLL